MTLPTYVMFVFSSARNSHGIHELGAAAVTVAHPSVQERPLAIPVFKKSNPRFALNSQAVSQIWL